MLRRKLEICFYYLWHYSQLLFWLSKHSRKQANILILQAVTGMCCCTLRSLSPPTFPYYYVSSIHIAVNFSGRFGFWVGDALSLQTECV
eukprot:g37257.t1